MAVIIFFFSGDDNVFQLKLCGILASIKDINENCPQNTTLPLKNNQNSAYIYKLTSNTSSKIPVAIILSASNPAF